MKTMLYPTDYHIHTLYSDGRRQPELFIEAALQTGLREIGFSDHLNPSGEKLVWCMDHNRLPEYTEHLLQLKEQHHDIKIRIGLEVDYLPGYEKETEQIISSFPFDHIIGSVHYMGKDTVDHGAEFYIGKDIDQLYEEYFNLISDAASTGFFDIMAHPDLIRIHGFRPEADITYLYHLIASSFKKNDVAFEINTNGRNKPLGDFYPDTDFLSLFASYGVPVCVNSDAHYPERVGQFFDEAYDLLKGAGYKEMAVFSNRRRTLKPF